MNNRELMDEYNDAFLFLGKFLDEFVSLVDQQYNLSHNAWLIMKLIRDNQQLTNQKIAEITKVAPASISIQLTSLMKRGFIKQTMNSNDRRIRNLTLTDSGLRIVNVLEEKHLARFNKWVSDLGVEETHQLLSIIKKFETNVLPHDCLVNSNHLR